jgi:tetratricopeptide (TPR) repeat protein
MDPASVPVDLKVNTWWHDIYAMALIRINRLDEAMHILRYVPDEKADDDIFFRKLKIYALKNQQDSMLFMINDLERKNFPHQLIKNLYASSIAEFALQKDKSSQNKWAQLNIDYLQSQPESSPLDLEFLAGAHYLNANFVEALSTFQDLANKNPSSWFWQMRLGSCYAKLDQPKQALDLIGKLETLETDSKYHRGEFRYATACIYAMLGEKERAVQNLKLAYQNGFPFHPGLYQDAFELIPLHGYAPYEEFVKPKD